MSLVKHLKIILIKIFFYQLHLEFINNKFTFRLKLRAKSIKIPKKHVRIFNSLLIPSRTFFNVNESEIFIQKSFGNYTVDIFIGLLPLFVKTLITFHQEHENQDDKSIAVQHISHYRYTNYKYQLINKIFCTT